MNTENIILIIIFVFLLFKFECINTTIQSITENLRITNENVYNIQKEISYIKYTMDKNNNTNNFTHHINNEKKNDLSNNFEELYKRVKFNESETNKSQYTGGGFNLSPFSLEKLNNVNNLELKLDGRYWKNNEQIPSELLRNSNNYSREKNNSKKDIFNLLNYSSNLYNNSYWD